MIYISLIDTSDEKKRFEQLYYTYRQIMFYVANRILKDEYLAEDAVYQAFIRIMNNFEKFSDIKCPKTRSLIVLIVENIAIDMYRKRKRENLVYLDEISLYIEDRTNSLYPFESDIEIAISKLPINYSVVIKLKYIQGYSVKEIAKLLDISTENVQKRIERARKKLKTLLEQGEN